MSRWRRLRPWLAIVLALLLARAMCGGDRHSAGLRVATFNIEDYPASGTQVLGAFAAIESLDAAIIGVQEITDPGHFAAAAREHLGPTWRFAHTGTDGRHQIGALYNDKTLELLGQWEHPETIVGAGGSIGKPAFEVRMRRRSTGRAFRLIVVHLKAGGDSFDVRERQLAGLERILVDHDRGDEPVVVVGDFNATGDPDRERIARLSAAAGVNWASEGLECTSYWNRRDGCVGTPLDHMLSSGAVRSIAARGPCASEGCARRDQCPVFHRDVSDHCPVVLELAPH